MCSIYICSSIHCLYIHLSICLSVGLSVCLISIYLDRCFFYHVYNFVYIYCIFICSSVHLSVYSSAHLFVCLSIPISFRLSCVMSRSQLSCLLSIICCHLPTLPVNECQNDVFIEKIDVLNLEVYSLLQSPFSALALMSWTRLCSNYIWRRVAETHGGLMQLSCRV